jgi:hypothetical protein
MPVSGERPHHELRQPVGAKVPANTPFITINGLAGSNGSSAGSISS